MKRPVINIVTLSILIINIIIFSIQFNSLTIINKSIPIIVNLSLLVMAMLFIYKLYKSFQGEFKHQFLVFVVSIILNILLIIINIGATTINDVLSKITNNDTIYSSTIIVRSNSDIHSINDLVNKKIGMSDNEKDYENYKLGYEYLKKNNKVKNNTFYKYTDYVLALNDLLEGKIDALIISSNYEALYSDYINDLDKKVVSIVKPLTQYVKNKINKKISVNKPFTVLIIGADGFGGDTYNADVLILMSVNPNTKKVVMVDVVRDTYAYNIGAKMMDKITHSGWYGNENVVNTVSKLFDINIDYYVKMNFNSVTKLINLIGGVKMTVPYRYPVKENGKILYYMEPGDKVLNGNEVLWLARTRKEPGSSLYTRGRMQMDIIEQTIKQTDGTLLIKNYFSFYDILKESIKTNISKENLYYYIQKYISIRNKIEFSHNTLDGIDSTYYHEGMKQQLYTYKYTEDSLNSLKTKLKDNLK